MLKKSSFYMKKWAISGLSVIVGLGLGTAISLSSHDRLCKQVEFRSHHEARSLVAKGLSMLEYEPLGNVGAIPPSHREMYHQIKEREVFLKTILRTADIEIGPNKKYAKIYLKNGR
jgi:hypothetical protein